MYRLKTTLIKARPIVLNVDGKKGESEFETGMIYHYTCYDRLSDQEVGKIRRVVKTADYDFENKKRIYYFWPEENVKVSLKNGEKMQFHWLKKQMKFGDVLKKTNKAVFGQDRYIDDKDVSYQNVLEKLEFILLKR